MKLSFKILAEEAGRTGFRPEVLEKVCRLQRLLAGFCRHPFLKNRLALKGGTALNLFLFDMPRLSVDIDLNYIGQVDREAMLAERPRVEQAIQDVCRREDMQIVRLPGDHAGGKRRLRYQSAVGPEATLEVDVNFLIRIPLWPIERRDGPRLAGVHASRVPVLDLHELAAGKFAALFARRASRDLFDSHALLSRKDLDEKRLRSAFLVYGGMNRKDWRTIDIEDVSFDATELRNQLVPMLSGDAVAGLGTPDSWAAELIAGCKAGLAKVWPFAGPEREFLDRLLDEGDLRPKLITDDDELAERIAKHPGLLWKAHNVREHRRKRPT